MKQDKYKIVATFKHGRVWSNGLVTFILLLAVVIIVGLAVLAFVEWNENIRLSIFVALGDLLFIGLFAFEFFKAFRNRSYAKKCATEGIEKTTVAKLADKVAGIFVPTVLVIALATFGIWLAIGEALEVATRTIYNTGHIVAVTAAYFKYIRNISATLTSSVPSSISSALSIISNMRSAPARAVRIDAYWLAISLTGRVNFFEY